MNRAVYIAAALVLPLHSAVAEPNRIYLTKNPIVQAHPLRASEIEPAAKDPANPPKTEIIPIAKQPQSRSMLQTLEQNLLYVSTIEIQGNYRLSRNRILQIAGLENAPAVWQVSAEQIRSRLMAYPWIEEAQISSQPYPASMKVEIKEAEPWLIAEYERHSWLVSRKGVLLQPLDALDNPEIILETTELARVDGLQPQPGTDSYLSSANARFVQAVKLVKLVETAGEFPFPIERYSLLPGGGLKITAPPGADGQGTFPQVLFAADSIEEAVMRVKRLKSVLEDLARRSERAHRIDLRFANQVIVE